MSKTHGQDITWAEHAAPIFYSNCVKCHNPNGVAPFELITYASAKLNKSGIKYMVSTRQMPPWTPAPSYRRLAHERILTQGEIDTLVRWVDQGVLEGDEEKAPVAPTFDSKTEIQNADLIAKMPDYSVKTPSDMYRCFVLPYMIASDKFITDMEISPGNKKAVHHVLLYHDATSIPDSLDALDNELGYPCFGGTGSNSSTLIGGWVPGQQATHLNNNIGIQLPKKAKLVMQVHYPAGIDNELDSTKALFKFSTSSSLRNLLFYPLLNHVNSMTDGPLFIPANTVKTFHEKFVTPYDASLLQIAPHMHLIGTSMKVWGVTPLNDTIPLIYIPAWNFHWQGFYSYRSLLKIPRGTAIYNEAVYDNTHANHHNPNHDGLKDVKAGEATSDEMMVVYFSFLLYQNGDENIQIDTSPLKPIVTSIPENGYWSQVVNTVQLYNLSPNPSTDQIEVSFFLPQSGLVKLEVTDLQGRVRQMGQNEQFLFAGHQRVRLPIGDLSAGQYCVTIFADGIKRSKQFIKQ